MEEKGCAPILTDDWKNVFLFRQGFFNGGHLVREREGGEELLHSICEDFFFHKRIRRLQV